MSHFKKIPNLVQSDRFRQLYPGQELSFISKAKTNNKPKACVFFLFKLTVYSTPGLKFELQFVQGLSTPVQASHTTLLQVNTG